MTLNEQLKAAGLNDHDQAVIKKIMGISEEDANKEWDQPLFICAKKDLNKQ